MAYFNNLLIELAETDRRSLAGLGVGVLLPEGIRDVGELLYLLRADNIPLILKYKIHRSSSKEQSQMLRERNGRNREINGQWTY